MKLRMFSNKHKPYKYGFDPSRPPSVPDDITIPAGQKGQFSPSSDERLWLFSRRWEPLDAKKSKATLIICHGTVDHSGVYHELATTLAKEGVAVFAQDMRGWGFSDGESMYMNQIDAFVEDVDQFYEEIHKQPEYARVKHRFILGKSIGGLVAAYSIIAHPAKYSGLIGLSPAYLPHPEHATSPTLQAVLKVLNAVAPSKLPLRQIFNPQLIVKDEAALQKWYDDPLCCKDKIRLGYAVEALRCREELPRLVCAIDTPMFMMIGEDDRVVSVEGLEMMLDCKKGEKWDYFMTSPHCNSQMKVYDGGRHNLLAEPELKNQVIGDIRDWILAQEHSAVCDAAQ